MIVAPSGVETRRFERGLGCCGECNRAIMRGARRCSRILQVGRTPVDRAGDTAPVSFGVNEPPTTSKEGMSPPPSLGGVSPLPFAQCACVGRTGHSRHRIRDHRIRSVPLTVSPSLPSVASEVEGQIDVLERVAEPLS